MAPSPPSPGALFADPAWLAHRLDPAGERVRFVRWERGPRHAAPFLIDAHVPAGAPARWLDRAEAVDAAPPPAPLHFVFHSAFCCSTLVANALEGAGRATTLKEPVLLNDLVGWRARGGAPRDVARGLGDALTLLGRPFERGEAVVIKPSNVTAPLWPAMLQLRPAAGALLLHAPLPIYLASIASKGMWGRLWVRELGWKLMRDGLAEFGFTAEERFRHSDLQVAAIGWLAQHRLFGELVARYGAARVATLDSETLIARPSDALAALAARFGLAIDRAAAEAIAAGPVFARNAKTGEAFGPAARTAVHAGPAAANADEIVKVAAWAEAVAAHAGVALKLPSPLLG